MYMCQHVRSLSCAAAAVATSAYVLLLLHAFKACVWQADTIADSAITYPVYSLQVS
jgi:hypothetical protein